VIPCKHGIQGWRNGFVFGPESEKLMTLNVSCVRRVINSVSSYELYDGVPSSTQRRSCDPLTGGGTIKPAKFIHEVSLEIARISLELYIMLTAIKLKPHEFTVEEYSTQVTLIHISTSENISINHN
jgi:hypothetical protein